MLHKEHQLDVFFSSSLSSADHLAPWVQIGWNSSFSGGRAALGPVVGSVEGSDANRYYAQITDTVAEETQFML